jgi:hypothetical protein
MAQKHWGSFPKIMIWYCVKNKELLFLRGTPCLSRIKCVAAPVQLPHWRFITPATAAPDLGQLQVVLSWETKCVAPIASRKKCWEYAQGYLDGYPSKTQRTPQQPLESQWFGQSFQIQPWKTCGSVTGWLLKTNVASFSSQTLWNRFTVQFTWRKIQHRPTLPSGNN